jgi:hypothetical protein
VAVSALSLAWTDLTAEQQQTLIRLRDLFRSGKDSRGAGDLNRLKPRPGIIGIADDLFPRQSRTKMPSDAPAMLRIKDYWPSDTRTELVSLALLTSIERFLKLVGDENCSRLLESLWRSTRANFSFKDGLQSLDSITRNMESEILPTLQQCIDLEKRAKECVSASGIEFEEHEVVVKAIGGFRQLLEMMKSADANAAAYRAVLGLFGSSIDVAKSIKALRTKCDGAQRAIDRLDRCGKDLIDNSGEYCRAVKYLGVDQESLSGVVQSETAIGQTCNLVMLVQEVTSRAERLEEMSGAMAKLQKQLDQLGETLGEISVEGDSNER